MAGARQIVARHTLILNPRAAANGLFPEREAMPVLRTY